MEPSFTSAAPGASIADPRIFLWKDPQYKEVLSQNIANYDLLIGSFSRSDFVSFTGAGVSKALGIKDWEELLSELLSAASALGFAESKPVDKGRYPEYAERLFRYLDGKGRKALYFDTIIRHMDLHISSTSPTLIYLSLCVDTHLTTNFDRSLEHAYSFVKYLAEYLDARGMSRHPQLCYLDNLVANSRNPAILYLHGSINQQVYILKESDYERYYPSVSFREGDSIRGLEDCLKYYYSGKSILFIGFSFEDPYLQKYFFNLAKEMNREAESIQKHFSEAGKTIADKYIRHFLLIDENNSFVRNYRNKIFSELQEYNIYPIIYKTGEHIFLEHLFKMLANKSRGVS